MNQIHTVPFGYVPPEDRRKGTLIFYDTFEHTTDEELDRVAELTANRSFSKLVMYPLHEETVKRMTKVPVLPYYKREDRLHEWKRRSGSKAVIDGWEGKRKKYTPLEAALRQLTTTYPAPHFLYVTPDMANQLASFSSFEEWIVKLRLVLAEEPRAVHPRLEQYRHRWETLAEITARS